MNLSKIKAVVFDCDGVMFDTSMANRMYYDEVLACLGKPPLDEEQFVNVHMMTVKDALEYLFPKKADLLAAYDRIKDIGYHKFITHMLMEAGLKDLLEKLKEHGFIRGVATNRTNTMETVLADFGLADHFEIVVTAATVANPKPAPDQLLLILKTYDLFPEQVLFIGDSDYDRQAALGAGCVFAAFKNPGLPADLSLSSMKEVLAYLGISE